MENEGVVIAQYPYPRYIAAGFERLIAVSASDYSLLKTHVKHMGFEQRESGG